MVALHQRLDAVTALSQDSEIHVTFNGLSSPFLEVNSRTLECLSQCHVLHCIIMRCFIAHSGQCTQIKSGFIIFRFSFVWGGGVTWKRKTALALRGKLHAALSIALFNGSIAIPTPFRMRSLFPYCYCTIRYLCGCPLDVNAYSLCQQSELNSTQGGESGGGRRKMSEEITKWQATRRG